MADSIIARPRGSVPNARRKGFGAFCALLAMFILAVLVNPFSASAERTDADRARTRERGASATAPELPAPVPSAVSAGDLERLIAAGEPIYCGAGTQPLVALTFDDGPGVNTQATIDLLQERGMTATFFTVGKLYSAAPGWAELLATEASFGAVGDHTWDHVAVRGMSASRLDDQILRTRREAERLSGRPVFLFRPPLGARDDTLDRYVSDHGMLEIMWSLETGDSQGASRRQIERAVREHLSAGDIVLLHEGRGTTQNALPAILDLIEARGYRAVTVPQLLAMDPPTAEQLRSHACP